MKTVLFISVVLLLTIGATPKETKVKPINTKEFKELIWDYSKDKEWKYKGDKPAIIDFYADWCGPCKRLSPILEEIQKEYGDSIQIYKVNVDNEKELTKLMNVKGIPMLLFIPKKDKPEKVIGFYPKTELEKKISDILKVKK